MSISPAEAAAMNENARLRAALSHLEALERKLTREVPAAEREEMERAQARADQLLATLGQQVSAPTLGETGQHYRARIAQTVAEHSRFRGEPLHGLGPATLAAAEDRIFADVQENLHRRADGQIGKLVAFQETDPAGRTVTKFYGDPAAWMAPFCRPGINGTINRNPPRGK